MCITLHLENDFHPRSLWIRFAYTPSPSLDDDFHDFRIKNGSVDGFSYQFQLNDNEATTIISGVDLYTIYECNLYIHTLDMVVSSK